MGDAAEVLDRGIPDLLDTAAMPPALAAEVDFLAGRTRRWQDDPGVPPALRARALLVAGHPRRATEELAAGDLTAVGAQELSAACWVVSRVGGPGQLEVLQEYVDRLPEGFVFEGAIPLTTREMLEGLLAVACGDLVSAARQMDSAVRLGDARAPMWGAVARLEASRVLNTCAQLEGADGELEQRAGQVLAAARAFFRAGAYGHLAEVAKNLEQPPLAHGIAEPMLGHLVRGEPWVVGFGVQPHVELGDRLGLRALEHLIRNRHRRVPAVELEGVLEGHTPDWVGGLDEYLAGSGGSLEDADLPGTLRDLLLDDRARSRISKLIRRTVTSIAEVHPVLGSHLRRCVTTGHGCGYESDPAVRWRLASR